MSSSGQVKRSANTQGIAGPAARCCNQAWYSSSRGGRPDKPPVASINAALQGGVASGQAEVVEGQHVTTAKAPYRLALEVGRKGHGQPRPTSIPRGLHLGHAEGAGVA